MELTRPILLRFMTAVAIVVLLGAAVSLLLFAWGGLSLLVGSGVFGLAGGALVHMVSGDVHSRHASGRTLSAVRVCGMSLAAIGAANGLTVLGLVVGIAIRKGDPALAALPMPAIVVAVALEIYSAVECVRAWRDFRDRTVEANYERRGIALAMGGGIVVAVGAAALLIIWGLTN